VEKSYLIYNYCMAACNIQTVFCFTSSFFVNYIHVILYVYTQQSGITNTQHLIKLFAVDLSWRLMIIQFSTMFVILLFLEFRSRDRILITIIDSHIKAYIFTVFFKSCA
jgi:hypothetical protein